MGRILLLFASVSVLKSLALIGYLKVAFWGAGEAMSPALLPGYIAFAAVVPWPFLVVGARVIGRVRSRLQAAVDAGTPKEALPPDDVRFFLRMHRWFIGAKVLIWTVLSLGWPLTLFLFDDEGEPLSSVVVDVVIGIGVGFVAGVTVFYVFEYVSRTYFAPVLLPESLEHLRPFPPFRIWQHLLLLWLTLGVVQPAILFALHTRTGQRGLADLYLIVYFLVVSAFEVHGIVTALARPAGRLDGRMSAVRDGNLAVRAEVRSLDTFGRLASTFNLMVDGLEQRERMRELFGRYVTSQVADEILAGRVQLGGERRHATVLFSDIRGFTTLSERLAPEDVVAFLNAYFEEMIECVLENGGTIDKFIGDAVMAVFGVPTSKGPDEDAKSAARCALEMSRRLDVLNEARRARGEEAIEIGIALHSGELVAGAIGSTKRMEYTVIGDTVNLTSRLEGLTKRLGRRVVVSDETAALIGEGFRLEALETLEVRGRAEAVSVFALTAAA